MSHELEQLNSLLHMVKSLVQNPYLYLGILVSSVMYCMSRWPPPSTPSTTTAPLGSTQRCWSATCSGPMETCLQYPGESRRTQGVLSHPGGSGAPAKDESPVSVPASGGRWQRPAMLRGCDFPRAQPLSEATLGIASHLQGPGGCLPLSPLPAP
ncbi:hypothetical protein J4Q44_G00054300 [Coregonus suidteri]|uniref:Uncharacterized protein n=1 Tax=Coregonus suidteri TaxID=861788 RepID=A0AAN8R359_9TELE